ncbi:hypothetical protein FQR65_LT09656 [Abscondita terminalis]|nr:hypothetical protein FQR65_LT09656 [Abscondita terminalis]
MSLFNRILLMLVCCCCFWKPIYFACTSRISFRRSDYENSKGLQMQHLGKNDNSTDVRFIGIDSKQPYSSAKVVFPDSKVATKQLYIPKCEHSHYCENIEHYPYNHLSSILSGDDDYKMFFGADEEPIENRISEYGETYLCPSIPKLVFPQAMQNRYKEWKYVINQGSDYRQGVRIETCLEENGDCKLVDPPLGYVVSCTQKYSYRRMLSVGDNGNPEGDVFIVPTACCCSYKRNY